MGELDLGEISITCRDSGWFALIAPQNEAFIEIDLGIKNLSKIFKAHKSFLSRERSLKRFQKKLARQVKDSNNYQETKEKINKLQYFVNESKKQAMHELTSYLSKNFKRVVIEGLEAKKNCKLQKSIIDENFELFIEQLSYKCDMYGSELKI